MYDVCINVQSWMNVVCSRVHQISTFALSSIHSKNYSRFMIGCPFFADFFCFVNLILKLYFVDYKSCQDKLITKSASAH